MLLRYVETQGERGRETTVLKMRGSTHDRDIREFTTDSSGVHVGKPCREVNGILAGGPRGAGAAEIDSVRRLLGR